MPSPLPRIARLLPLLFVAGLTLPGTAGEAPPAPGEIPLRECLVLPPVGRGGRAPVHADPIEARIVAGRWAPPKAGDAVTSANGAARAWETARPGADGWLQHPALAGGYAS